MARLEIDDGHVRVALNSFEAFAATRRKVAVPLTAITTVAVADSPYDEVIEPLVRMGFSARSAPGARVLTVGPPAHTADGQAMLVVYRNQPSVVIETDPELADGWSLIVVSMPDPAATAATIRDALP